MNDVLSQILAEADEEINYPLEGVLERFLPWSDDLTDYVCAAVMLSEDMVNGDGEGKRKKEIAVGLLRTAFDTLPLPPVIGKFLGKLFEGFVSGLIDLVVGWFNKKFPQGFSGLSGLVKPTPAA